MQNDCSDFLDAMNAIFLLSYISASSRVTPQYKTLIDNIFSNMIKDGSISGKLVTKISDY